MQTDPIEHTTTWHAVAAEEALRELGSRRAGLSDEEAADRLSRQGPNRLPAAKPRPAWRRFLAQFDNMLIYVLMASAAITAGLGHGVDAGVIAGVVVINAVIGFIQEGRAERALDAIRDMMTATASVIRDGRRTSVNADTLVAGDVVLLEAGDRVPADLRLLRSSSLRIEEAVLTGESVPVDKAVDPVAPNAALGDRRPMAFSGTMVVGGQAAGLVVATGARTELGRISAMVGRIEPLTTPLLRQMDRFAQRLTFVILALSALVFAFAVLARDYPWEEAFLVVVGIAVAAIPEGLPAVMTITLAIGVRRMAARNAIIRRLPAVETLGSVSTICTDKTGTLTRNEMTVATAVTTAGPIEVTGAGYAPQGSLNHDGIPIDPSADPRLAALARGALLCNDAVLRSVQGVWQVEGDPMEGALITFAHKAGLDEATIRGAHPRQAEIPFDARHRFMATLHEDPAAEDAPMLYLKGAPEQVLMMCDRQAGVAGHEPLDRDAWHARLQALAEQGQRVIAIATRRMAPGTVTLAAFDATDARLCLLGLLGLNDPPREEAIAAVADCQAAGIRVVMITGDHAVTAAAIARRLGLDGGTGGVLTGADLDTLDESALAAALSGNAVLARTSPEHKLRVVQALQAGGAVVAMTGDGVNDAPALKRADVGVAMGRKGTEAAKEAAQMVLADDNFATIAAAVREGRTVYDNLLKVIAWTLPTNGGEAMVVITAIALGLALPMTAVQILWINMITAVTLGLVLAFEPAEADVMRRPPRDPTTPILSGFVAWRTVFVSFLFMVAIFGIVFWGERRGLPEETSRTMVVGTIVVLEIAYLFSVRYQRTRSFTWRGVMGTQAVWIGLGAVVALQLAFTYAPPLQYLFQTTAVSLTDGLVMLGVGFALLPILEIEKLILRSWAGRA
ncbi:MAG: HAD-IC family P-type ATPase [Acetobacteraceae bacterium]